MKWFNCVVILSLCLVGYTQGGGWVDQSDCKWVWGWYGVEVTCPYGYAATGACAGGGNLDCQGQYSAGLKCCVVEYSGSYDCITIRGTSGEQLTCDNSRAVYSTCGSGGAADCGGSFTAISCCKDSWLSVNTDCRWTYGSWGDELTCDGVLTGRCGSGEGKDCPNDSSHGIRCCFTL